MFLLEGLPAVALGVVVLATLPERPDDATWLTAEERQTLVVCLRHDMEQRAAMGDASRGPFRNGRIWRLAIVYFTIPVALYAIGFWLPQIVKSATSAGNFMVGVLSAVPYVVAAVGMVIVGRHSDRTGERRWHIAVSALVGGAAFAASAFVHGLGSALVVLSIAMLGLASMFGPFWTLVTTVTNRSGAAVGIALINSVGNIGGFVGPYLFGAIREATESFSAGLTLIGVVLLVGGAVALTVRE